MANVTKAAKNAAKNATKRAEKQARRAARKVEKQTQRAAERETKRIFTQRQADLEEAFSHAKIAGSTNNAVYLSKESPIYNNYYNKVLEQTGETNVNLDSLLQESVSEYKAGKERFYKVKEKDKRADMALESKAYEELGQYYLNDDITKDMIANQKAAIKKNAKYERVNIGETQAEIDLRNRLSQETEGLTTARTLGGTSPDTGGSSGQRSGLSGSSPEPDPYSTRQLKANRYNDKESYMKYSVANQYDDAIRSWESGDYNNPILESLKSDGMDLKNATKDDLFAKRSDAIKNASGNDMGFGDWMGYTRTPQYATAIGGTAWLVSRMSSTKGQQTNSQLYGQSPY